MIPTIISRTEETIIRRTTVVEYRGDRYVVIDLIDSNGTYIDSVYRGPDGVELEDANLIDVLETLTAV